jgi:hypothetical protein
VNVKLDICIGTVGSFELEGPDGVSGEMYHTQEWTGCRGSVMDGNREEGKVGVQCGGTTHGPCINTHDCQ